MYPHTHINIEIHAWTHKQFNLPHLFLIFLFLKIASRVLTVDVLGVHGCLGPGPPMLIGGMPGPGPPGPGPPGPPGPILLGGGPLMPGP